ncbi:MAG: YncE family protein, partial [Alistipes sp.]|nr:YncE family protein [Alistipes sp.]
MNYGPMDEERFDVGGDFGDGSVITGRGLFIANEGNFMYGNASLSYYDPERKHVENEVFARANAQKLGD